MKNERDEEIQAKRGHPTKVSTTYVWYWSYSVVFSFQSNIRPKIIVIMWLIYL
jgi:hypothetical protein